MKRRSYLLNLLAWLGLAGCTPHLAHISAPEAITDRTITIYVPGFGGSALVKKEGGSLVWISSWAWLWGDDAVVYRGGEVGLEEEDELTAAAVLTTVPVVPFLKTRDVRQTLFAALRRRLTHQELVPFPYDWRRTHTEAVKQLVDYVLLAERKGVRSLHLICEGDGGLICAYFLRYGDQSPPRAQENWWGAKKISKVVFISTPFKGSVTAMRELTSGTRVAPWPSLSPETLGSFPASYEKLPSPRSDLILSPYKQSVSATLYGGRNWLDYGWGFLDDHQALDPEARRQRYGFVQAALEKAMAFSDKINAPAKVGAPRSSVLNIYGNATRTLTRAVWHTGKKKFAFSADELGLPREEWEPLFFEMGDGRSAEISLKLPTAFAGMQAEESVRRETQDEILTAPDLAERLAAFLNQGS